MPCAMHCMSETDWRRFPAGTHCPTRGTFWQRLYLTERLVLADRLLLVHHHGTKGPVRPELRGYTHTQGQVERRTASNDIFGKQLKMANSWGKTASILVIIYRGIINSDESCLHSNDIL